MKFKISPDIMERKICFMYIYGRPAGSNHPLPKPSTTSHKISENHVTPLPLPCGYYK